MQFGDRRHAAGAGRGIDDPAGVLRADAAEYLERPVLAPHDRRHGQRPQTMLADPIDDARLEADRLGGANQIALVGVFSGQREFAAEMDWIGGDAIICGDRA